MDKRSSQATASQNKTQAPAACRVLLVDRDAQGLDVLKQCTLAGQSISATHATTLAEAQKQLSAAAVDVVLVATQLPDGNGIDLVRQVTAKKQATEVLVLTSEPSFELAREAIRAGAGDLIAQPLQYNEISERLTAAVSRQSQHRTQSKRLHRLRRLCKKLDTARKDVADQVDVLCNDLVVAYQELASQMQQVVQTSEYGVLVREELDLEQLIRKTLEYIIEQAGATNAALFLPSGFEEFSLGGYVNYDCSSGAADMLLEHLADVIAPKVSVRQEMLHLTTNEQLNHWIGDDAAYLADAHVLAFSATHENESLAVVVLFRDSSDPFPESLIETTQAIAPMLGEALGRIIRVHHRHVNEDEDQGEYGDYGDFGDLEGFDTPPF